MKTITCAQVTIESVVTGITPQEAAISDATDEDTFALALRCAKKQDLQLAAPGGREARRADIGPCEIDLFSNVVYDIDNENDEIKILSLSVTSAICATLQTGSKTLLDTKGSSSSPPDMA